MMPLLKNPGSRDLENIVAHANPSYGRPNSSSLPSNVAFNDNSAPALRSSSACSADRRHPRPPSAGSSSDG